MDTQEKTPNDGMTDRTDNCSINNEQEFVCIEMQKDLARSEATFRYTLKNISKMEDIWLSSEYYICNLPWRIMMVPITIGWSSQTQKQQSQKYLGFSLLCNRENKLTPLSCHVVAELRLLSYKEGQEPFSQKFQQLYKNEENDWNCWRFMTWQDVLDPDKDFIKEDSITLEVHVVADEPHGVKPSWDSKKHTGYVGLKNQIKSTYYMNSLLQTLYFINQLRKAVYQMPTESDDSSNSVALALQRIFHELHFSDKCVDTKKLIEFWLGDYGFFHAA